jgi:hypothetical protein
MITTCVIVIDQDVSMALCQMQGTLSILYAASIRMRLSGTVMLPEE